MKRGRVDLPSFAALREGDSERSLFLMASNSLPQPLDGITFSGDRENNMMCIVLDIHVDEGISDKTRLRVDPKRSRENLPWSIATKRGWAQERDMLKGPYAPRCILILVGKSAPAPLAARSKLCRHVVGDTVGERQVEGD